MGTAAAALAAPLFVPRVTLASGARSGDWCRPLTKAGRDNIYDFTLDLLDGDGKQFSVSAYEGKPLWLNFFASWCPPCNNEIKDILDIAHKYDGHMSVVGIDVGEDPGPVRDFRERHKVTYPIALDPQGVVFKFLVLTAFPTHIFLDGHGSISCVSVGDLTPQQMDNEIAVAIDRVAPYVPSPGPIASPSPSAVPSANALPQARATSPPAS